MRWVRREGWHRQTAFASKLTPTGLASSRDIRIAEIIVGPALAGKAACQAIKLQQIKTRQIEQSDFTYAALIRVQPLPGLV